MVATPADQHKKLDCDPNPEPCVHTKVQCIECGKTGSPGQLLGSRKRGPRSPQSAAQSRAAAKMGGFPLGRKRKNMSLKSAAEVLSSNEGEGIVKYEGVTFDRAEAEASSYAAQRGGKTGITITGAKDYIRSRLKDLGVPPPRRDWGGVKRGEMTMDQVAKVLVSEGGPNFAVYRGVEFSTASVIAYAEERGKNVSPLVAMEYIQSVVKKK